MNVNGTSISGRINAGEMILYLALIISIKIG